MTFVAEWNTLAFSSDHDLHPERLLPFALFVQVREFSHVMHFYALVASAYVARIIEEPFDEL